MTFDPEFPWEDAETDLMAGIDTARLGVLHFAAADEDAQAVARWLLAALPAGSYLAVAHATDAVRGAFTREAVAHWNQFGKPPMVLRSPERIGRLFDGLQLLEPGIVSCSRWRPEAVPQATPDGVDQFCGVGQKPGQADA